MATPRKTQIQKIENVLMRYNDSPGVSVKKIAALARVPTEAVSKRISDLREYYTIYTNWRKVDGKRTAFYRLAD
jgi:hypothetical protein